MLSVFPELLKYQELSPLFLRLALAVMFFGTGRAKILTEFVQTANVFKAAGFKREKLWVYLTGLLEIASATMFALGIFTQIACVLAVLITLFMIVKIKRGAGFIGGWDFDFLVLAAALSILVSGPGIFSFDLPL
ncbi:MAG: DoxX family protein [Candidatus Pacebacteria bacterium]|nr:DoxX family protein [Candidatus Paceibacterota bacterium]